MLGRPQQHCRKLVGNHRGDSAELHPGATAVVATTTEHRKRLADVEADAFQRER